MALDTYRHFVTAAEKCFVTQPTLSMMVQKLEEELDAKIFDRSKNPVVPTGIGEKLILQARKVLREAGALKEIVREEKQEISGELFIGIIPTLAPYLLPLFVNSFTTQYPRVTVKVREMVTAQIVSALKKGEIDAGILVTPLEDKEIKEWQMFYERFLVYTSENERIYRKKYILPRDIKADKLWLMEEGHCFRSQIMNLCELRKKEKNFHFEYEAGSLETLKKFVDTGQGITIIPELATLDYTRTDKKKLKEFKAPQPVREVSLVFHREFVKQLLLQKLHATIVECLPPAVISQEKFNIISIQ